MRFVNTVENCAGVDVLCGMERQIERIAAGISFGMTAGEARAALLREGCTEEKAFLIWSAAKVFERNAVKDAEK